MVEITADSRKGSDKTLAAAATRLNLHPGDRTARPGAQAAVRVRLTGLLLDPALLDADLLLEFRGSVVSSCGAISVLSK